MLELVMLGTSASAPSIRRGLSSALVSHKDRRFLVDCGEGTQRQILKSGLGFKRMDTILLTHGHLDHILGLGGLISTFARWEAIGTVRIYGGSWALDRVRALMQVVFGPGEGSYPIEYHAVRPGPFLEYADLTVSAFPVRHRGPGCYGYIFQEPARRPFLAEVAEALGVPAGPERGALVRGESVTLVDGRVVAPEEVLGPEEPGTKMAFVGDAGSVDDLVESVRGADCLVIESTYLQEEQDLARRFGHLTATEAARLARTASVGKLILTHISRRHSDQDVLAEAQAIFPNVTVARDFDAFRIPE